MSKLTNQKMLDKPTPVITRDTVKRLAKDVSEIIKNPLTTNGIYYVHDDTDMLRGKLV